MKTKIKLNIFLSLLLKENVKLKDEKYNRLKIIEAFRVWILTNIYYDKSKNVLQNVFDVFYTNHNNVNDYSYNLRSIPSANLLSEERKNYIDEDMNTYYISSSDDDFSLDIILNEGIKNEKDVKKYLRIQYRI